MDAAGQLFQAHGVQPAQPRVQRIGQGKQPCEGTGRQQQRQAAAKAARIGDQIPHPRRAHQPLHLPRIDAVGGAHRVRRLGVELQPIGSGVARDRRTAQALEDAELDLVRAQRHQAVETGGKARHVLAGQAGDQVHVQVGPALGAQPAQVVLGARVVLPPCDQLLDGRIEGLDADLELQRAGRKLRDRRLQPRRQVVGNQLEVQERRIVRTRLQPIEKELQDAHRGLDLEVEGAVDELEAARAAPPQRIERLQERLQRKRPGGRVQGRQAELALERAAARGLHVEVALRQVGRAELAVGQRQVGQRRLHAGMHLHQRPRPVQDLPRQRREAHLAPAGDRVVGGAADGLLLDLVADFRAAEHHRHLRRALLEQPHHRLGLAHIPDVHPEADDARRQREQPLHHLRRRRAQSELGNLAGFAQLAQVGAQAAQAKRGVRVAGVEGGEDDGGHGVADVDRSHGRRGRRPLFCRS